MADVKQDTSYSDEGETPILDETSSESFEEESSTQQGARPAGDVKSADKQQKPAARKAAPKAAAAQQEPTEDSDGEENGGGEGDEGVDALVYDNWVLKQPVEVQELLTRRQQALRDALVDERKQRKELSRQVQALGRKLEGNTTTTKEIQDLKSTLRDTALRASFYESVPADITNAKLAFSAARESGLIDGNGRVEWAEMRTQYPELFRRATVPTGNAGTGAKQQGADTEKSMNAFIRAALGRE